MIWQYILTGVNILCALYVSNRTDRAQSHAMETKFNCESVKQHFQWAQADFKYLRELLEKYGRR